ncbi:phage exclusion protein Lit family protein [Mucilaginibacter gossypii]|uniref:phage exclusion protein Lit family protein n=1 Tax=Mucilaginibacter gossypii TaxID=551996 RepID=UPI000DCCA004|nr:MULTISPECIES: phage exclusion protein Lit family protein [Mucilaginibacter]QTE35872.1 phage exclusion protein Lit family protein [Mucilaginibacter gossypii]RAV54678.1 hypothetical protein DIU36_20055 [Mucilaginibacter rubeus]
MEKSSDIPVLYIDALYGNIDETFRTGNKKMEGELLALFAKGKVKGLYFEPAMYPMKGPYADLDKQLIVLQAGFLSYLWTVCYFMIGLIDIYQEGALQSATVLRLSDDDEFLMLNNTLGWGRSLKFGDEDELTPWPAHIPNPTQSERRVLQANHIFVLATCYLMYHEVGHLAFHADAKDFIKTTKSSGYVLTNEDKRRIRTMETQADFYALDCMIASIDGEHGRYHRFLGAIIAQLSEFFVRVLPAHTRGGMHPDLDERLKRILNRADIQHPGYKVNIDLTSTIGLQLFFALTFANYIPEDQSNFTFDSFEDLKKYLFNIIGEWKDKYHAEANKNQ